MEDLVRDICNPDSTDLNFPVARNKGNKLMKLYIYIYIYILLILFY
jgi:hypothetical protein